MACNAMGEAAGIAAAISLKRNLPPRKIEIIELQKTLINNNCNLGQKQRNIPDSLTNYLRYSKIKIEVYCRSIFKGVAHDGKSNSPFNTFP